MASKPMTKTQLVAALAEKIVEEEEAGAAASAFEADDNDEMDPFSAMTSMSTSLIEDELVGDLLQSNQVGAFRENLIGNSFQTEIDVAVEDLSERVGDGSGGGRQI